VETNIKKLQLIKVKLTQFKFEIGNSRGYNNMIRKCVKNINDPNSKEMTISSGSNMVLSFIL